MAISRKQALAFFKAVLSAKNVQGVCEGILGVDEVPTIDDFKSRSALTLDKCETFTAHMMSCIKIIDQELHGRERQGEIDFDGKPGSKKKKNASGLVGPLTNPVKGPMFSPGSGGPDKRKAKTVVERKTDAAKKKTSPKLVKDAKKKTKKGPGK